jgi:hypothetical protein
MEKLDSDGFIDPTPFDDFGAEPNRDCEPRAPMVRTGKAPSSALLVACRGQARWLTEADHGQEQPSRVIEG